MLCSLQSSYFLNHTSTVLGRPVAQPQNANAIYYSHPIKGNVYVPFGREIIDVEIQKGKLDPL